MYRPKRVFTLPAATLTAPVREADGDVRVPSLLGFGIREREERMLFEHLLLLSADMNTRHEMSMVDTNLSPYSADVEAMSKYHERQLVAGVAQANVLANVVDLRNANATGIAFENRRRVIEAFSEPGNPNDTGRTGGARCDSVSVLSLFN
jgi:small subunit ribosomal protein S15